jgi:hypothetical protein
MLAISAVVDIGPWVRLRYISEKSGEIRRRISACSRFILLPPAPGVRRVEHWNRDERSGLFLVDPENGAQPCPAIIFT